MVEGAILATVAGLAKFGSEIVSAKDETERNKLLLEFQKSVIAANLQLATLQQENSTLKGAIEELKREAVRKENWENESKRYALHDAAKGLVVYGLKRNVSNGEPAHYLCVNCFNDGKKTVLYYSTKSGSTRSETLNCKVCKTEAPTGYSGGGHPVFALEE